METTGELRRKRDLVQWCGVRLAEKYGIKVPPVLRPDPLDELILTVLSQNTNDRNRDGAYTELRRRFPRWEEVAQAPVPRIAAAIRGGGLAHQKAGRIKEMLRLIKAREGRLELKRVCDLPLSEAMEYLLTMKGVGEKTAACVLLFSCGKPVFPVDTHILRVAKRLKLIEERTTAAAAHQVMGELVPAELVYSLHLNMIEHGRARCHPRKPECTDCCLRTRCRSRGLG